MFEFHAFKALRWTKATGSDMPKCIVRLVKEVHNTAHNNFTVSATSEGKSRSYGLVFLVSVQIEAIGELNEEEGIAIRLDDGELQGGWLTTFTGFLIAPKECDTPCPLPI